MLALAGIKLPGLNFRNQRVEAAYRKELVYGEDNAARADPTTVGELFSNVRRNYFRLYFHYAYFNVFRGFYIQADNIFAYLILIPTIAAGQITFGILQPDPDRLWAGFKLVSIFGGKLDDDHRTFVDP